MVLVFSASILSFVLCGTCTVLTVVVVLAFTLCAINFAFLLDSDADTEDGLKVVVFDFLASFFTSFSVFCNIAKMSSSSSSSCFFVVAGAEYMVGADDIIAGRLFDMKLRAPVDVELKLEVGLKDVLDAELLTTGVDGGA